MMWAVYVRGLSTDRLWEHWADFEEKTEAIRYKNCLINANEADQFETGAYDPEFEVSIMEK